MKKFYKKELSESPVYVFGSPLRFDFLATEDPALISELDRCVSRGIGGIVSIEEQEYVNEVKKKESETQFGNGSKQPPLPQRQELTPFLRVEGRVAAVVSNPNAGRGMFWRDQAPNRPNQEPMPDPITIPAIAQFAPPPTAKVNPNEMK